MHMLGKIIRVMKMNYALLVCFDYIVIKQKSFGNVLADLTRHIVTLNAVYGRVLIGIFLLYLFVVAFDKA